MLDNEMLEQFQLLASILEQTATKDDITSLRKEIRESETRTKLFIENTMTAQIKGLFDGYQSALENQALLKIANEALAKELDTLKMRVTLLENKTA